MTGPWSAWITKTPLMNGKHFGMDSSEEQNWRQTVYVLQFITTGTITCAISILAEPHCWWSGWWFLLYVPLSHTINSKVCMLLPKSHPRKSLSMGEGGTTEYPLKLHFQISCVFPVFSLSDRKLSLCQFYWPPENFRICFPKNVQ